MRARLFLTSLLTVIVALATTRAFGIFDRPRDVPVDRLVKNLESYIAEHPDDAQGYYNLARVHSLPFTLKARSIGAFEGRALPMPAPDDMQRFRRLPAKIDGKKGDTSNEEELSPSELQRHARDAVQNYNKAIELDRKQGLFFLSLGSFLEFASAQSSRCWSAPLNIPTDIDEKAKDAGTLMVQDILSGKGEAHEAERIIVTSTWDWSAHQYRSLIAALQHAQFTQDRKQRLEIRSLLDLHWKQATKDCYYLAFKLSFPSESQSKNLPIKGLEGLISHEAAQGFLRVTKEDISQQVEKDRVQEIRTGLAALLKIPPSFAMTPIIFSMSRTQSVRELVSSRNTSTFDLDGTGRPQKWTWVRPETGMLVWDPFRSGRITSGRQLFGSVTWWMFWENGYRALDALDDNRDGALSGAELAGLAVWFDRNGNGASDPGEVTPVESLGISRISCRNTTEWDGVPANPNGLTLADGTELPTYDWIAVSATDTYHRPYLYASLAVFVSTCFWIRKQRERRTPLLAGLCGYVSRAERRSEEARGRV